MVNETARPRGTEMSNMQDVCVNFFKHYIPDDPPFFFFSLFSATRPTRGWVFKHIFGRHVRPRLK